MSILPIVPVIIQPQPNLIPEVAARSLCQRVWGCVRPCFVLPLVKDLCVWGLRAAAQKCILWPPRQGAWQSAKQEFEKRWMEKIDPNFAVSSHSLRLHGGVAVQVLIFRDKSAHREDSLVPTVVFFSASGNSCYGGEYESIMNRAFVAHYVLFNYPGVADSKGQLKTDAAFSDAAKEVVTFAARELKTPLHRIHLLGRSLGGAVAAGLKGMMPELGSLVLDRSPSSIPDVIRSHIGCSSCCLPILTPLAFDSRKALGRLREERYWVLYHPEDRMIKPEATLKDEPQANVVELRGNPAIEDVHNQPLGIGFGPAVILLLFREVFAAPQRALYQFARGAPPDPSERP